MRFGTAGRMLVRNSQAHEDGPPVVDQGRDACHDLASLAVARGEARPGPLVLQLVAVVLRVPAIVGTSSGMDVTSTAYSYSGFGAAGVVGNEREGKRPVDEAASEGQL